VVTGNQHHQARNYNRWPVLDRNVFLGKNEEDEGAEHCGDRQREHVVDQRKLVRTQLRHTFSLNRS